MAALKEALIQLAQTVDFQYLNMASKGTELEAQELQFAVLAAIRDDECVCEAPLVTVATVVQLTALLEP
jgi:hypothetical protein